MTQLIINVGNVANDGQGTPLRTAFEYINNNFTELYSASTGVTAIANGTSNVSVVSANGNISTSVGGTSNVMVVSSTSVAITGDLSVSGNATLSGNILGDRIVNGTTEFDIQVANGNANLTIGGTSNVVVWDTTGQYVTGLISASGNVTGGNVLTAGLISATSTITSAANITGGNVLTAGLISATGNIQGGNLRTAGLISATSTITSAANITGGNLLTGGLISATANITGGNVLTGGLISATGNVAGNYFIGNGSQLTGIAASYGNANVVANVAALGTNPVSTTGNVTGGNLLASGNLLSSDTAGSAFTILGSTPTVANTTGGAITLQSGAGNGANIGGSITIKAGNSGANTVATAWGGDIYLFAGNTTGATGRGGNVRIYAGQANGNATFSGAVYLTGGTAEGGSGASGASLQLPGGRGNTSGQPGAFSLLGGTAFGTDKAGLVSTIIGSLGTGSGTPGNVTIQIGTALASGNTAQTGSNVLVVYSGGALVTGIVSATANVTGNYFIGNGSQLTGITASAGAAITNGTSNVTAGASGNITVGVAGTSNVTVFATTGQYVTGLISASGNVTGGNILTAGLISATGAITSASNISLTGNIVDIGELWINTSANGNININVNGTGQTNIPTGILSVTGNIQGGNLRTAGLMSATGNIFGGNLVIAGNTATITTANYSIGYLNVPQVSLASNITTALVDSGKHYYSTNSSNSTLTVADNSAVSWPVGTSFIVVNRGTGNVTVAAAAGVSLYLAGNSTAANRVLTTYGIATCLNLAANVWMISGSGLA